MAENRRIVMKLKVILMMVLITGLASAQSYHIDWYVISGGGGHCQSGSYQLDGTIGQSIVGHSLSSDYRIDAGFWSGGEAISPGCVYIVGDANNSHAFTGLDVTYSVRYFKGGPLPPYSCDCPPGHIWYVAGDVNGSCSFSGLDVTYMVRYFKGGPGPIPCPDCPPRGLLAPPVPGVEPTPTIQPKTVPTLKAKGAIKVSD
jgi:hypothetical protein